MTLNKEISFWESKKAGHTAVEINQQPKTWKLTLDIIDDNYEMIQKFIKPIVDAKNHRVIFTGAGTSEFVGNSLTPLLRAMGSDHYESVATTDLVATPELYIRDYLPTLLVSFGRSGNSPESIGAIDISNVVNTNLKHLVITCNHEGNLAMRDDASMLAVKLPPETNDLSFAMTSSFTNMFLAAYAIFSGKTHQELVDALYPIAAIVEGIHTNTVEDLTKLIATVDFNRIVYLGDADLNGFAQESALKMLEQSAGEVVTMFNTPLGFRHGPKSIINNQTLTVVYLSKEDYTRQYQIDIIKEMNADKAGNTVMVLDCKYDESIQSLVDVYLSFDIKETSRDLIGLVYINVAQLIAMLKSIHLGKSPDNPWPSGMVNRVVKGVTIYEYTKSGVVL